MEIVKHTDVNKYYRTGGINPALLSQYRLVIIAAAVGKIANPILREQIDLAASLGLHYATYAIPAIDQGSMESQADFYLDLYGVLNALTIVDIEKPYTSDVRAVNSTEALRYRARLERRVTLQPWNYSNPANIQLLGYPNWLCDAPLWLAQWYYYNLEKRTLYPDFDTFLAKYANVKPYFVRTGAGKKYAQNIVAWQFTCKGDAPRLIANERTADPVYPIGIKSADLNVSLIEPAEFMRLFGADASVPPPMPTLEERVTALETWAGGLGYVP